MIQGRDLNRNVNTDDIILLLDDWYAGDCMDNPSTFHMREYYALDLKSMILILQRIWRPYHAKNWKNTSRQWMMRFKLSREVKHGRLFQGTEFLITICFQEHGTSSSRGNLI